MTTNRLAKSEAPQQTKRTAQEWCDIGNARLAGLIPYEHSKQYAGQYLIRDDVHWVVRNGVPCIEHRA